jgi:hypothetical protein
MIVRTAWKVGEEGKEEFNCIRIREFKGVTEGITGIKDTILNQWVEIVKHKQDLLKRLLKNHTK